MMLVQINGKWRFFGGKYIQYVLLAYVLVAKRAVNVDLPAPLRPTNPTLTLLGISILTPLSTQSLPWWL